MFNTCARCGEYRADKIIDPEGPYAICPVCEHPHPFLRLPLMVVSGASGAGKTTICLNLLGKIRQAVLLDSDIFWRAEFNRPEENYREFHEMCLRVCKSIGQSGRPVVLFGAGIGVPENVEPCVERRYFSELHYLALVCEEKILAGRLRRRGPGRKSSDPAYIAEHVKFNRWFKECSGKTDPPVDLLDTSGVPVEETTTQVAAWIRERIQHSISGASLTSFLDTGDS